MEERPAADEPWLTPAVGGIGLASFFSDLGHEIPTALLPGFLTTVLGAPAIALGLIEGVADALSGAAKFAGGALADDPTRRRSLAVGGYVATATLSALIGVATAVWQVALLRAGAWSARGLRTPARNALLADATDASAYGRAYGFERAMDNLGAVGGPILAVILVALVGFRVAILLSVIPGFLAAGAIVYAIHHVAQPRVRPRTPVRLVVRPLLHGALGRLLVAVALFEAGNMAATLLILRASTLLATGQGTDTAALVAIALYVGYNIAGTIAAVPAGRLADTYGARRVFTLGAVLFGVSYLLFAASGPLVPLLAIAFVIAGVGIGTAETAESAAVAALAPAQQRGSAFGLLAGVQSLGDFTASATAGVLWTLVSPTAAFLFAASLMAFTAVALVTMRGPAVAPG